MASLIYGVSIQTASGPVKKRLRNPAAPPPKPREPKGKTVTKVCGANLSFVKNNKVHGRTSCFPKLEVPVENHINVEAPVENPIPVVENLIKEEAPVENPIPVAETKPEGWKAKREKKKVPYGLKENPEAME
jgi:hypothetical protein